MLPVQLAIGRQQTEQTMAKQEMKMESMEERVIAFSEQLGRVVGTVQAKAEGWMDRDALKKQIVSIRDGAADLLEQMAAKEKKVVRKVVAAVAKGRSGGYVDAPGKKHRKPMPRDTRAIAESAKAKTKRAGASMVKTMKQRGRG
jgi:hypothetical protein